MKPFFTLEEFTEAYILFIRSTWPVLTEEEILALRKDAHSLHARLDRVSTWHVIMVAWGDRYLDAGGDSL